ncbi:MAG: translation initiation factor 2 [Lachnospiraceae bacterium]|nr:translation initiation factor 2 [Lachnospiraceae bacterium]
MATTNVRCPICGTMNYNLYLDETNGWMECEHCGNLTCQMDKQKTVKIPVFTGAQLAKLFNRSAVSGKEAVAAS